MSTTDMPTADVRRLTRSRDDRIVAGVSAGIARYFDIDPVIPRVVLAVLAVFGGAGIVIYAFAWLLMPEDGSPSTRAERWLESRRGGDRARDLLIVLIALIAVSFLFTSPFAHRISTAAFFVVLVMVVAALIGRRRTDRVRAADPAQLPFGPTAAPYGPQPMAASDSPTTVMTPPASVRAPKPRSWLGWLTFGAILVVAGSFSAVAAAGWAHPQPADVLAACVAVLGIGVLVGAFYGRAWSLIPLGVLLVGALAAANALPRNLTWTAGSRDWAPTAAASPQQYVLGAGDAHLDLTQLPAGETASISSRVGAGRLVVVVPINDVVKVHATTSAGRIEILDDEQDGTGVDVRDTIPAIGRHPGTLTLDLQMGYGDVEVRHAAA